MVDETSQTLTRQFDDPNLEKEFFFEFSHNFSDRNKLGISKLSKSTLVSFDTKGCLWFNTGWWWLDCDNENGPGGGNAWLVVVVVIVSVVIGDERKSYS